MNAGRTLALLLLPAVALLLLGAHFFRASLVPLTVACLGLVALLFVRARWAWLALQVTLALGAIEWLRTAWAFASARALAGQPYGRLLVILGAVALVTAAAALVLRSRTAREHFRSLR
jgi:O-antigen ligase